MKQEIISVHETDDDGMPAGGTVHGTGIDIRWQNGPLGRGDERIEPNGAFVEGVIEAAIQRLEWYQEGCEGKFECQENAHAITYLRGALDMLESRTKRREKAGVEGTHAEEEQAPGR